MHLRYHVSPRRTVRLLSVAAAVSALFLMAPGSAQAATGRSWAGPVSVSAPAAATLPSCPTSTLCTFQNSGYTGTRWNFAYASEPHGTWFFVGSGANDQISSYYNNRAWISYFAKNCRVDDLWTYSFGGVAVSNLNDGLHNWPNGTTGNDSISAIALGTSSTVVVPNHGAC
jgi:peptidase inhibitor family I36